MSDMTNLEDLVRRETSQYRTMKTASRDSHTASENKERRKQRVETGIEKHWPRTQLSVRKLTGNLLAAWPHNNTHCI